jgi:hypothetical protein
MSITQNIVKNELKLSSKKYYKFEHNLLILSINKKIDGALLEWNNIYKEKRDFLKLFLIILKNNPKNKFSFT